MCQALSSAHSRPTVSTDLVFPAQVVLAFLVMGLLARWYVAPRLAALPRDTALQPLLVVQTFRYIGLGFLAPALVRPALAQTFAVPAALGTTLAAILALAAIAALRKRSRLGIPLTWAVTVIGLADFLNAFIQARSAGVVGDLGAAYFIPIVIVPAAVVSHVLTLSLLLRRPRARGADV
jgi:FtsH-binding integral membrane protein